MAPNVSVAVTVKLKLPAVVGVPDSTPTVLRKLAASVNFI